MSQRTPSNISSWTGLGFWNFYFLCKLALLLGGYLNFHPLVNLVFAAFLLFPLSSNFLKKTRAFIALPTGIALFYHDTWLPAPDSIMGQGHMVLSFTFEYFIELLGRFINWNMVGIAFIMLTGYLFLVRWLRFTPWILLFLLWQNIAPYYKQQQSIQTVKIRPDISNKMVAAKH